MEDDPEVQKVKMPKIAKVKNKMPAPVQITAEQLLREAKERELELVPPPPKQKISDPDELAQYKLRKRKAFEDNIRKNRGVMSNWIKYAAWEESQKEIQRARSVWERALDVDHRNITLWLKYAEMEMKSKQINHARNLWDRAVTILPRANQLWYKYTYMEEMLHNIAGTRQTFERWMEWQPNEQAWHSYINFELRYKELDRARTIYEQFVMIHPEVKNWIKYARFEDKNGYITSARNVYERGVEFFGEDNLDEQLLIAFAKFEEKQKEHERARVIYKYGLDHLDKAKCEEIYKCFTIHEKKFGSRAAIEDVIVSKRRFHYEEEVKMNPSNYDAWFDYLRLLESDSEPEVVRETYERAIANLPPLEKRHWRRYIYLWVNYALYEELVMDDIERTREVYKAALDIIPHKKFTFAKLWIMYSQFEVRQKNLGQARKIMGAAIGKCPKTKIFRGYIDLEIQLREFERCRILYEKFLQFNPGNCSTWIKYAELESILGDNDRARAVYELATNQISLDMPEVLWKSYIDYEIAEEEFDRTRKLYRRLLERTQHVKVWISFAQFEKSLEEEDNISRSRAVYKEGCMTLRSANEKEERLMLLESWLELENEFGSEETQETVAKMMPQKVKKRRKIQTPDEMDAGWEEFYDYIFPDDEAAQPNLKLLAMAKRWKEIEGTEMDDSDESGDDDVDKNGRDDDNNDDNNDDESDVPGPSGSNISESRTFKKVKQDSDDESDVDENNKNHSINVSDDTVTNRVNDSDENDDTKDKDDVDSTSSDSSDDERSYESKYKQYQKQDDSTKATNSDENNDSDGREAKSCIIDQTNSERGRKYSEKTKDSSDSDSDRNTRTNHKKHDSSDSDGKEVKSRKIDQTNSERRRSREKAKDSSDSASETNTHTSRPKRDSSVSDGREATTNSERRTRSQKAKDSSDSDSDTNIRRRRQNRDSSDGREAKSRKIDQTNTDRRKGGERANNSSDSDSSDTNTRRRRQKSDSSDSDGRDVKSRRIDLTNSERRSTKKAKDSSDSDSDTNSRRSLRKRDSDSISDGRKANTNNERRTSSKKAKYSSDSDSDTTRRSRQKRDSSISDSDG